MEIRDRVQSHMDAGKSLEEVQAARPTEEWDETMGTGFINGERLTELMYRSLTGDR